MSLFSKLQAQVDNVVSKVDDGLDAVNAQFEKGLKHARAEVIGTSLPVRSSIILP